MQYSLMHKDVEVSRLDIDDDGVITGLSSVSSPEHMPVGTMPQRKADVIQLRDWWHNRCIPVTRNGAREFLERAGLSNMSSLLTRSYGLSLSDQYWIRPVDSSLGWGSVNFFENPFTEDVGNLLFGRPVSGEIDLASPDNTSDGILRKRWAIVDGRRCLIKSGTEPFRQEPVNEAVATMIMEAQGIPCVHYDQIWVDDVPCSICDCFVTPQTELVSAMRVVDAYGLPIGSKRDAYEDACAEIGVDIGLAMAQQDFIDYMMMNGDRHLGNYGLIRDADTLEWIGPAPIFDTGTSLMCRRATTAIPKAVPSGTSDAWAERLFHSDLDWLDMDALHRSIDDASEMIRSTAARLGGEGFDDARADALIEVLRSRAEGLEDLFA